MSQQMTKLSRSLYLIFKYFAWPFGTARKMGVTSGNEKSIWWTCPCFSDNERKAIANKLLNFI